MIIVLFVLPIRCVTRMASVHLSVSPEEVKNNDKSILICYTVIERSSSLYLEKKKKTAVVYTLGRSEIFLD